MEEETTADKVNATSSSLLPSGLPINWGLITGPVPEPVFPAPSLGTALTPAQTSAVHTLQTKVRSVTERRTKGSDRVTERERLDTGETSSEVAVRHRPQGKSTVSLPASSWRPVNNSHSSVVEEEEVEFQVKLEIHSPPTEAQEEKVVQGERGTEGERSEGSEGRAGFETDQPCSSLESLVSTTSGSVKDNPAAPPPFPVLSSTSAKVSTSSTSTRRWAPPKGFWRVARPETLLLNGVGPHDVPFASKDTQTESLAEPQRKSKTEGVGARDIVGFLVDDTNASSEFKYSDSVECCLDRFEQETGVTDPVKRLDSSDSLDDTSVQGCGLSADEKLRVKQRAYVKLRERKQHYREQSGGESTSQYGDTTCRVEYEGAHGGVDNSDSTILQELEPYLRSLLIISDELPLSPRHEQAKRLLERARLKARSNHVKEDRPCRRSYSDQRPSFKKQQAECHNPAVQKPVDSTEDLPTQTAAGPLLVPDQRDTSPSDQAGGLRRYGCSPTRVRFEDESEKEAESRYLDRVRHRGRPGVPKSRNKDSNTDSSSSGSERGRSHRSVSVPPSQKQEDISISGETTTVIREIIVLVKKCEACGSIVREPQTITSLSAPQIFDPQQTGSPDDPKAKAVPCWVPPNKPEVSTRPKAPLTVTFAGAYVLGENKESSTGWKSSGFGKLRRRSRKGESRIESGHGPYGPSWAQRRNSNPRNRVNMSRAVTFAPDSPVTLEPRLLEASGGCRESQTPALPIKSALKSSSRNRSAAEARRESPVVLIQGTPAPSSPVPCVRPSSLRYSPARITTDLPAAEAWDTTPDVAASGDPGPGSDFHPALRGLALSRAEDLRAELLRAEHLKAEAIWEENSDGSKKLDGRPKLFLRRFFSSIGLNSVGRLVKGGRSSSMEQLSLPTAPRANTASPSPTRRPQTASRIQRTPSLQSLHTVLPLAQLRKASSVQSLERRTERTTILGEVQIPYGLAPSPDSPQLELHRALSVEDILTSRTVRPVGRVSQAFHDGSLLLELIRPPNGPFGFVISRGKGRPDTGVYIEKVGDGSCESPYVGLLGIGDEILQVNGEAVAGLSLDQVTRLMTRESIASLRIMPARRSQR